MAKNIGKIIALATANNEKYNAAEEQELGVLGMKIEAARKKKEISKKDLPVAANGFDRSGEPIPDINPDISNNINSNISIRRSRAVNMIPDGFDEFWKAYPKKVAKQDAVRAFKKLKPNAETVEAIIADVKARTSHEWNGKELQYIPHPATYLRGKRWEDETEVTQIAGRSEPDPIVLTDEEERIIDEIYARNGRDAFM